MSIQINTKKTSLDIVLSWLGIFMQIFLRMRNKAFPKVFFRYKTHKTHVGFSRFYDQPPVKWSNWHDAKLMHWINYPRVIDRRPFIIESNDHPLAVVSWKKRVEEPWQVLEMLDIAAQIYENKSCKAILIPCLGFRTLFEYYFSKNVLDKLVIVSQSTCIPRFVDWEKKVSQTISFACLASDYERKGVDIVLEAWQSIAAKKNAQLILACPNIPESVVNKVKKDESIKLIQKGPLTQFEKHEILANTHITIAPTHIHGGTNISEGIENGHALILFEYHAKAYDHIADVVNVPYFFYSPHHYGSSWKTFDQFFSHIKNGKQNGAFDNVINTLAYKITEKINSPSSVFKRGKECHQACSSEFSVSSRNDRLLSIYLDCLQ